jgi:hypothetical protein
MARRSLSGIIPLHSRFMPILHFEGSSDDTFGEVLHTNDDYDNCASGEPIEYLVQLPDTGLGVLVTGQYCPGFSTGWMIGVSSYQPDNGDASMPGWPIQFQPNGYRGRLMIVAPEGVVVRCLTRELGNA